jgi:hypothetical protein
VKCSWRIYTGSARHAIPISATYKLMFVPYFLLMLIEFMFHLLGFLFNKLPKKIKNKKAAVIKSE